MTSETGTAEKDRQRPLLKRGMAWIVASGVLAIAGIGGGLLYGRRASSSGEAVTVRVLTVEREDVERTVTESGTVKLGSQQTLESPSDATVAEVRVAVGDRVAAGEELVVLRDAEQLTQLEEHLLRIRNAEIEVANRQEDVQNAQQALDSARRTFESLRSQMRGADRTPLVERQLTIEETALQLENQRADAEDARANRNTARDTLERDRELHDRGFISLNQLQQSENALRQAEANLRQAELQVETTRLALERQRAGITTIQRSIEDERAQLNNELQTAASDVRTAEIQLSDAQFAADSAELNLQQLQIQARTIEEQLQSRIVSAPTAGQVLDVGVVRGDVVELGAELLTIGDPNQEIVELQLSTLNARDVQPNQPARISVIGPDSETYDGRVERVSLRADPEETTSSRSGDTAAVSATVRLDAPSGTLIPGSQVSVEIVLEGDTNALSLNLEAIQNSDDDPFVWEIDEGNVVRKQPITVGLNGLTSASITAGLEAGDRVAVPPVDAELSDGTAIEAMEGLDSES